MSEQSSDSDSVADKIESEMRAVYQSLWYATGWVPPFEREGGRMQLASQAMRDADKDGKLWSMYLAGKMEAYEHAIHIIRDGNDGDLN